MFAQTATPTLGLDVVGRFADNDLWHTVSRNWHPVNRFSLPWILAIATGSVALLGLLAELAYAFLPSNAWSETLVPFFSLSAETNLPTWYSSGLLLVSGLLLLRIARRPRQDSTLAAHWWLLALIFFYISLDETAQIHEALGDHFGGTGLLYFSWVIPASIAVLVVFLAYLPFLRRLPKESRNGLLLAGALYVTGALLIEFPLGAWTEVHGDDNLTYALIDWLEETLEMVGVSLFIVVLSRYGPEAFDA